MASMERLWTVEVLLATILKHSWKVEAKLQKVPTDKEIDVTGEIEHFTCKKFLKLFTRRIDILETF